MSIFGSKNKRALMASYKGKNCGICGKAPTKKMTIDHIIAKSKGGTNSRKNLQYAHLLCNRLKSDK